MADFEPTVVAFVCNWCTYAGADLTGTSRIKYASNVRIIRLPCTGRIDFLLLLQAFGQGADGVIVSGCHPNDCHYTAGNFHARRRWMMFRRLLDTLGIDVDRIHFSWISAAEGAKWAETVNEFVAKIRALGPYKEFPKRLTLQLDDAPLVSVGGLLASASPTGAGAS
jgi:coenzyme F420-reducing hydrogenase delta subunit